MYYLNNKYVGLALLWHQNSIFPILLPMNNKYTLLHKVRSSEPLVHTYVCNKYLIYKTKL